VLHIESVSTGTDDENLVYRAFGGELRIAWHSLSPRMLKEGDVLLKIRAAYTGLPGHIKGAQAELGPESNLGDFNGNVLHGKRLEIPGVVSGEAGFDLAQTAPNPANTQTTIRFALAEAGMVKLSLTNIYGEELLTILEGYYPAGIHNSVLSCTELPAGIYLYSLTCHTASRTNTLTKRLIVIH
jgi:hypothetical protein